MGSDKPESLSPHIAKMRITQSDLMHVHRQMLQFKDAERLARAPQASHAFENESYVLLEPVNVPKDRLHRKYLGPYKILSSNRTSLDFYPFISTHQGLIFKK